MPADALQLVPTWARDELDELLVYFGVITPGADPFLSGAYFALATATDALFGEVIGQALFDRITDLEVLGPDGWTLVA